MNASVLPNSIIDECGSTNDLIRQFGEAGAPSGSWISARRQTQGRGRLGRTWVSEPGNLFLSYLVRPLDRSATSWIPLIAGLAAFDAILSVKALPALRLKWPNDLWIGHQKVGGILCEGVSGANGIFVGVGIGINCTTHPELSDRETASLDLLPGEIDGFRQLLIKNLHERFKNGSVAGRESALNVDEVRKEYLERSIFTLGSPVYWGNQLENSGECLGLGSNGELQVRLADGSKISLFAEEVSPRPAPRASS